MWLTILKRISRVDDNSGKVQYDHCKEGAGVKV